MPACANAAYESWLAGGTDHAIAPPAGGVSVVSATWNERPNLPGLVGRVRGALAGIPHEVIIVDDSSPDDTYGLALKIANVAVCKKREGQSIALLTGIRRARYPIVVTIDTDLENDPKEIPHLLEALGDGYDLVVATRPTLPRWSERLFARTIGKKLGIGDVLSNFRAMRTDSIRGIRFRGGETFGAEFLIRAYGLGLRICQVTVPPTARRPNPRIGGSVRANFRILGALVRTVIILLTMRHE